MGDRRGSKAHLAGEQSAADDPDDGAGRLRRAEVEGDRPEPARLVDRRQAAGERERTRGRAFAATAEAGSPAQRAGAEPQVEGVEAGLRDGEGADLAAPAAAVKASAVWIRPARKACTRARPRSAVRKRSVTWKPEAVLETTGRPRLRRAADPAAIPEPPAKAAVTRFAASISTVQVGALPVQAPPQPVKVAPGARVAVRPTLAPCRWRAVHVDLPLPQVMPPPVTVPWPVTATVSATCVLEPPEKVAVTLRAALIVNEHVRDEPLHAPPQAWNVSPELGSAVSVTFVPAESVVEQVVRPSPQLRPPPVTVPLPVTETLSGNVVGPVEPPPEKFAVTLLSPLIVTVQVAPLELVQPLQLVNEPPEPAVAARVTSWPESAQRCSRWSSRSCR